MFTIKKLFLAISLIFACNSSAMAYNFKVNKDSSWRKTKTHKVFLDGKFLGFVRFANMNTYYHIDHLQASSKGEGFGSLLFLYFLDSVWDKKTPITLESALGSGGFWAKMGFIPLTDSTRKITGLNMQNKKMMSNSEMFSPVVDYFVFNLLSNKLFDAGIMELSPQAALSWKGHIELDKLGRPNLEYDKILEALGVDELTSLLLTTTYL